jgi:hypothetical protein
MRALRLEFWSQFVTSDGEVRELKDPESPATYRQLSRLNYAGCLVIVEPGTAPSISKGEAAFAVSVARDAEPVDGQPPRWGFSS